MNKSCQDSDFFHLIILRKCFINISDHVISALPEAMLVLSKQVWFSLVILLDMGLDGKLGSKMLI